MTIGEDASRMEKGEAYMPQPLTMVSRRNVLRTGAAAGAAGALVYPATSWGASETPVKIGMVDPRSGTYAALGENEIRGAKLAVDELNKKNGILGRPAQLIVEDSQGLPGPAVAKTHKLLNKDKVNFLMGAVSSAVAEALS